MSLAQRVRDYRYSKGWGPDELASRAAISRTALYQIESGKTEVPRAATLRRIAVALEVSMDALLGHGEWEGDADAGARPRPAATADRRGVSQRSTVDPAVWKYRARTAGATAEDPDGSRFAIAAEEWGVNDEPARRSETELIAKLRALLASPYGEGIARILEESYRLLPGAPG
jgi:transcriptional regulator with XRE-family HTH domain